MMIKHGSLFALSCVLLMGLANAEVVVVEGRAALSGDISTDRDRAIDDAIKKALLMSGVQVQGRTFVRNGKIESDSITMSSSGNVKSLEVLEEWDGGGFYFVNAKIDISKASSCEQGSHYGKSVFFSAFQRDNPGTSVAGKLSNVDKEFSKELSSRLYRAYSVMVSKNSHILLPQSEGELPDAPLSPATIIRAADDYKSQFVVAGSITDMSMIHPEKYFNSSATRKIAESVKTGMGKLFGNGGDDYRLRNISFRMTLYDGVGGAVVFDKTYAGAGIWDAGYTEEVGFGTPRFWKTGYGKVTSDLMDSAMNDLGKKLLCQPFMIDVEYLPAEDWVYFPAGVNQGIKVGDVMSLYFKKSLQVDGVSGTSEIKATPIVLKDMNATLSIIQAYPSYSIAKSSADLRGGHRYIAVSW
jgi:hypothetical protein